MSKPEAMRRTAGFVTLGLVFLAGAPVGAQDQKPAPPPCSGPEHRQFDFWVGEWDVATPDGKPAGTNRIESILGGCVLMESWESTNGKSVGHSFNLYAADGRWHQTWVDNSGTLLELVGGLEGDRMVMSQERTNPDGRTALHEISWTKLETGQVKQHWRFTTDGGQTWKDLFVGIYTRQ
jgi:hypothetical protein